MTGSEHISQEDLALYAMQTLHEEESASIRAHLAACALCCDELAELSGDLALVGLSVEQHSLPEGARQRFVERISATPSATRNIAQMPPSLMPGEPRQRGFSNWLPWAAAAILAVTGISLGLRNHTLNEELRSESDLAATLGIRNSHAQQVLEVLTAPSAQRVTLTSSKTQPQPTGRAIYLADRGGLIFQGNNLEALPPNKTYELWVIPANGSAPIPAGLFRPDAAGSASVVLPPLPKGVPAKAFGVTIEKSEGSDSPTAPIILSGAADATPGA